MQSNAELQPIRALFKNDTFATGAGIQIESAANFCAVCSVRLGPGHKNAAGTAQGGLIFTLADFAFAVAANSHLAAQQSGAPTVTLNSTVHFLHPATAGTLTARARPLKQGGTVSVYEVTVEDEDGKAVARVSITGYTKPGSITLPGHDGGPSAQGK